MPNPIMEYERKFIVRDLSVLDSHEPSNYLQGYFNESPECHLRVRIKVVSQVCTLAIKGRRSGFERSEKEWSIEYEDAMALFESAPGKIEKRRYSIEGFWDVDVFGGANTGLAIAEFERSDKEVVAALEAPEWCGREVTASDEYYNQSLSFRPWPTFTDSLEP